jgi:hypothetical protein
VSVSLLSRCNRNADVFRRFHSRIEDFEDDVDYRNRKEREMFKDVGGFPGLNDIFKEVESDLFRPHK